MRTFNEYENNNLNESFSLVALQGKSKDSLVRLLNQTSQKFFKMKDQNKRMTLLGRMIMLNSALLISVSDEES